MRYALIGAVLAISSGLCSAAGIYKWVDADGTMHFSSTPPPEVMEDAEQVGRTHASGSSGHSRALLGTWYGIVGEEARRLIFREDAFNAFRAGFERSAYSNFINGNYQFEGGYLELRSTASPGNVIRERHRVIDLNETQLTLADEEGQLTRYVRQGPGDQSPERDVLHGRWFDPEEGLFYHFNHATLELSTSRRPGTARLHANYWIRNQLLTLEYLGNSMDKQRIAEREQWQVLLLERAQLRLKDPAGRLVNLERR